MSLFVEMVKKEMKMPVEQTILEHGDQFREVLRETAQVLGQQNQPRQSNETLAFNNFTKDPGWGDWYKSDEWGKK